MWVFFSFLSFILSQLSTILVPFECIHMQILCLASRKRPLYVRKVLFGFRIRFPSGNRLSGQLPNNILAYYLLCESSCCFHMYFGKNSKTEQSSHVIFKFSFFSEHFIRILHSIDLCSAYSQFLLYASITTRKKSVIEMGMMLQAGTWHISMKT